MSEVAHVSVEHQLNELCKLQSIDRAIASGKSSVKANREFLRAGADSMAALFNQGIPASTLVPARAQFIDQVLLREWHRRCANFGNLNLVAVGGYGRGELHPGSDIDLMILIESEPDTEQAETLSAFLTFLWDIGLEVGHSMRTLDDCVNEASADIGVATNLMESRLLAGNPALYESMREQTGPAHIWPGREFFAAKWEEQTRRHHKYHDTEYSLEPNIKSGPGGLRDLQMIGWVAKRHFDATSLHDLVEHQFLTEAEYQKLAECQAFLWQIRFALHQLNGRREDRLLFEHQRELAKQFGYVDQEHSLAIEQFMQIYYRTIMSLSRLNGVLLQSFEEAILLADEPIEVLPLNRRFQSNKGFIEAIKPGIFKRYPFALLEIFLLLQQNPHIKGVRANTVRLIRDNLHLINTSFRADIRARSLFLEILRQPWGTTRQLHRMNHYGVLAAYLPEFAKIVGRMQYDLFHAYTVDQHTLFLVRNITSFNKENIKDECPLCHELIPQLHKPEIMYIAALYHDIAKGRGGDHSELGAEDARDFCQRHGLSNFDTGLVCFLVRHHLLMSVTAQKKDISDPEIINEFARNVGDEIHLNHLYVLTVADIRATNPSLWTSWRKSLLMELYHTTCLALRRGLSNPVQRDETIADKQEAARKLLRASNIDHSRVNGVWREFSEDYFTRYSIEESVWHTRAILKKKDDDRALILAHSGLNRPGTEIFIYMRDRQGLFATSTAALDYAGVSVLDARIITSKNGYSLDSYTIQEIDGSPLKDHQRVRQIVRTLSKELNREELRLRKPARRTPRSLRHFQTVPRVNIYEDSSNQRSVIELVAGDRPGLLAKVGAVFSRHKIKLQNAKISTMGERAEDIFFVTNEKDRPLSENAQHKLSRALEKTLHPAADTVSKEKK